MSRSRNSRKGHYGCQYRRKIFKREYDIYKRGKTNRKYNTIKFYDILFSKAQHCGGLMWNLFISDYRTRYHYLDHVLPAKKSYTTWSWLKGKSNVKGWMPLKYQSRMIIFEDGGFTNVPIYERCHYH